MSSEPPVPSAAYGVSPRSTVLMGALVALTAILAPTFTGQSRAVAQGGLAAYQEAKLPASTLAGVVPGPGGRLYGVTYEGGQNNLGTIFSATTDLATVTILHHFNGDDGRVPYGELTADGSLLYGTTSFGGPGGDGTVFSFDPVSGDLRTLASFGFGLGRPTRALLVLGEYLYGSTTEFPGGGSSIFRLRKDGSALPEFKVFDATDGYVPGTLIPLPDGYLYGPAEFGGQADCYPFPYSGCGTIFRIRPDLTGLEVVYRFNKVLVPDGEGGFISLPGYTFPQRKLLPALSSSGQLRLYGTTYQGMFSVAPNPADPQFQLHYTVPRAQGSQIFAPPIEGLDGRIYINQYDGGDGLTNGVGSVYSMTKLGGDVQTQHLFNIKSGGEGPYGVMYQDSAGTIYGTTEYDETQTGPYRGTLFAIRGSNQAPTASATAPATVAAGANCLASVALDGSASSDPNGDPLTYEWRENGSVIASGVNPTVSLGVGPHAITLKVSDPAGANASTTVTVTVTSDVTLTYLGPNLLQSSGSNVLQAQTSTANGPLADVQLTFTVNGTPYQATTDGSGIASVDVGPIAGVSVVIEITTTGGSCGTATTTVTKQVNRWPVASGTASAPNPSDSSCTAPVTLDASASFDLDGDTLTYRWAEGATTLSTAKTATVTLSAGTHSLTLTVDDGRGGSASTVVTVEVLGQAVVLEYTGPAQLTVGVSTPVSARLRTVGGAAVVGATIRFTINGVQNAAVTDAAGNATANVTAPVVGPTTITVSSILDNCYQSAQITAPVTVIAQAATLVVIKTVINDNDGTAVPADFTMTVSGVDPSLTSFPGSAAGTTVTLNAGSYSVNEINRPGYDSTIGASCNGTIALGETKTCTIVNNDRPTTLTLTKSVINDSGGSALASAWTLTGNGTTFVTGVPRQVVPGSYLLAESGGPAGYTPGAWVCQGATLVGNTVTVAATATASCTITNDDQPAQLTLTKRVVNDNGGNASVSDWQLSAGAIQFVSGVSQNINAGTYALAESGGPGGYVASGWSCIGGQLAGNSLTLGLGVSAACTITNDDQGATLTVVKHVINDNGGPLQASDFRMTVTGTSPSPASFPGSEQGTVVVLAAGAYSVSESPDSRYAASFSAGCAGTIAIGESRLCTVTNDDRSATLTLTKVVLNDNGGTATPAAWTLSANGAPFASGVTQDVPPGNYTLAESGGPSGYTAGPWFCNGSPLVGNIVNVPPSTPVLCFITNDDQPARLTLTKIVVNDNGGTAAVTDWQLTANGQPFQSGVSQSVNAAIYSLLESGGPAGYTASAWVCAGGLQAGASVRLLPGEQADCTIGNDDQPGSLRVVTTVINTNNGTAAPSDFTMTVTGSAPSLASFPGNPAGTLVTLNVGAYGVSESGPAGYRATPSADCTGTIGLGELKTCTITNSDSPSNTPPVAQDQDVTTREDTPIAIALTATDADNDPLTYAIVNGPANGSLSNPAPNVTYTPNPGFYGIDSFTFRANDGKAESNVATVRITVTPVRADVAITIVDAPDPVIVGQPLTYTIRVTNLGPAAAPATSVTIALPVGVLVSATPPTCSGAGALACPQGTLAAGDERILVVQVVPQNAGLISAGASAGSSAPDPVPGNNSATADTTVSRSPTTVTLISAPNPSIFSQPVTFTATVTGFGPSGIVTFMDGATVLGSATLVAGTATLATSTLSAGTHPITVSYAGDGNNLPGVSAPLAQVVQPAPTTTTLGAVPNPSTVGTPPTFTATVAGPAPSGNVSFYDGATLLGTGTLVAGSASLTINLGVGQHVITAVYDGDANHAPSTSPPLTEVVNNPNGKTTTVTTLVSSANPSAVGQPVTFTATVTGANPTGTVTFKDVNGILGTALLVDGVASLTVPGFKQGAHQISADYGGDTSNLPSTSSKLKQQTR